MDRAIGRMAPAWPTGELAGDGAVVLSAAELEAAAALGLPSNADSYELAAAFIPRKPVPAAFVTGPFSFASLPELFTLLAAG